MSEDLRERFEDWYKEANSFCEYVSGVSLSDLADKNHWLAFREGTCPQEHAAYCLTCDGFEGLGTKQKGFMNE
jgi:hypothetical protein